MLVGGGATWSMSLVEVIRDTSLALDLYIDSTLLDK